MQTKSTMLYSLVCICAGAFSVFITITVYKAYFDTTNTNVRVVEATTNKTKSEMSREVEGNARELTGKRGLQRQSDNDEATFNRIPSSLQNADTNKSSAGDKSNVTYDVGSLLDKVNLYVASEKYNEVVQKGLVLELNRLFRGFKLTSSQNADLKGAIAKLDYFEKAEKHDLLNTVESNSKRVDKSAKIGTKTYNKDSKSVNPNKKGHSVSSDSGRRDKGKNKNTSKIYATPPEVTNSKKISDYIFNDLNRGEVRKDVTTDDQKKMDSDNIGQKGIKPSTHNSQPLEDEEATTNELKIKVKDKPINLKL